MPTKGEKMRALTVILFALILNACASSGGVQPIGKDTYTVGVTVMGGMESWPEVKARSLRQANEHCDAKNMQMELINDVKTSGARGWTPMSAEVNFKCVNK
jgi:hypothetical protein